MVQIDSADVIRLILQYLHASGLQSSYRALSQETQVSLNYIVDKRHFLKDISEKKWDAVLETLRDACLPPDTLTDLFVLIFLDCIAKGQFEAARVLLKEGAPMKLLRESNQERFSSLESALVSRKLESILAKEAEGLAKSVPETFQRELVEPLDSNRLLTLLSDALKWQLHGTTSLPPDTRFDLLRGITLDQGSAASSPPLSIYSSYSLQSIAICMHPSGRYLCNCSPEGFITLLDWLTGGVCHEYEMAEPMAVPSRATCCRFSAAGNQLAVGMLDGSVAVFRVEYGHCKAVRLFSNASQSPINSVDFGRDGNILASSGSLSVLGLRSGSVLRQVPDVSCAYVDADGNIVGIAGRSVVKFTTNFERTEYPLQFTPSYLSPAIDSHVLVDGGIFDGREYQLLLTEHVNCSTTTSSHHLLYATDTGIHAFSLSDLSSTGCVHIQGIRMMSPHPCQNVLICSTNDKLVVLKP